ncbi:MAG: class I poly(R)-hydroxyalkanoic acid synthase [Neomegalonema sp.]|nr:class I poly(R)-hydroxyalkanoic acid synthase [Neomegalonema sp.]
MAQSDGSTGGMDFSAAMDPQKAAELSANVAKMFEKGRKIWETAVAAQSQQEAKPGQLDPFNTANAFADLWRNMLENPKDVTETTLKFWSDQTELWRRAGLKAAGAKVDPVVCPDAGDKRFKDAEWSENAVFDALKQSYLLTAGFMMDAAEVGSKELPDIERRKISFFTRQFVEAISPTNYFATNPEVLRATLEEKGENLVRGLDHMLEDMERGRGQLMIKQTDMDKFKIGENVATTPGKVIYRNEVMELIQYAPTTENVRARPLLIAPPWINKFYILDLNEKKSLVRWLVAQGHSVFVISWVNPDASLANKEFVDYIAEGLFEAAAVVLEETGADDLDLAAYCIGGTMTGSALSYLAQEPEHPLNGRIASATFFTAQFEFSNAGELQIFVDDEQLDALEDAMSDGVLNADKMASSFNMLRASDLIWGFVVNNYLLGKEPFPFDMLYWNSDSTNMPAQVHRYYLRQFYRDNALATGALQMGGRTLDLGRVDIPTYHVATKEDHIAPADSVYRGVRLLGGDRRFVLAGSGHIAGVVNPPASNKYQFWTRDDLSFPENVHEWRKSAVETAGSWWGDWDAWLRSRDSAPDVPARTPGAKRKTLCDAPGEYVRRRFDL